MSPDDSSIDDPARNPARASRRSDAVFAALYFVALAAPLLGWLGIRGFVGAHGFDTPDVRPRFSARAVLSGAWQREVAEHFAHIFFGRTEALFLKNGLHDAATFGRDRAGAAGSIVQGRSGVLFERQYLDVALDEKTLPIERKHVAADTVAAICAFRAALAEFRPDGAPPVMFVLAPSKAETFREWIPRRFLRFATRPASRDPEPYRTWKSLLDSENVPYASPDDLAAMDEIAGRAASPAEFPDGFPGPGKISVFPYSGTHWTVAAAALAASAALERAAPQLPRPSLAAIEIVRGEPDYSCDRDLARLLNIPVRYRRSPDLYAHAVFGVPAGGALPADGLPRAAASSGPRLAILGDSFGDQFREALVRGGVCSGERAVLHFNELPSARDFRELMSGADAVVFVYSAPSLASTRASRTLLDLANALVPRVRVGRRYALGRSPYVLEGEWGEADGGRVVTLAPGAEGFVTMLSDAPLPVGATVRIHHDDPETLTLEMPLPPPTRLPRDGDGRRVVFRHVLRVACPPDARAPLRLTAFEVM